MALGVVSHNCNIVKAMSFLSGFGVDRHAAFSDMLGLYNAALLPVRGLLPLWAAWRGRGAAWLEWEERRARRLPVASPGGLWLHGASVGEAFIVSSVARALRRNDPARPLSVSAVTPAGRELLPAPPDVDAAFFAPLDLAGLPARVLSALRPSCLILVETELWPNTVHEARQAGVPIVIVNGRLSPRRMSRYSRLAGLYTSILTSIERIGAQSPDDAERFRRLGVPGSAIEVTGNIKYDLPVPAGDASTLRKRLGVGAERPIFIAGSTGQGEDDPVLDAFEHARRGHPGLFLVLAPRHVARAPALEHEIRRRGLGVARLSALDGGAGAPADVLLVDTLGELAQLYTVAEVAFVGGSLVPVGGHNVLEPAAVGVPVLFGPHTEHVDEPARALLERGAGWRVRDGAELARRLTTLLGDREARANAGARGREVLQSHRGALAASVDLIEGVLRDLRRDAGQGVA